MFNINIADNQLFLFWNIGKIVFDKQNYCDNSISKYSEYFSYKYGTSCLFSRSNINYMKKFYCCFPIFINQYNLLSFDHYKLLVNVNDIKKRYFYFYVSLFCKYSVDDLKRLINLDLYNYI